MHMSALNIPNLLEILFNGAPVFVKNFKTHGLAIYIIASFPYRFEELVLSVVAKVLTHLN